jgi:hypothetical protein
VDYTEFREEMRAKYCRAGERRERRARLMRICLDATAIILTAALLALIVFRLTQ